MKKEDKIMFYVYLFACIIALWIGISTTIQRFECPKMTQTELFLNTFNSILLNFRHCK